MAWGLFLGWRVPYMIQWFWVIILPLGVIFCPEAPWWLVRKGRYSDAKTTLIRLVRSEDYSDQEAEHQIALMRYTTELERSEVSGASFWDCFRGTHLRRTEIVRVSSQTS